ncbi:cobyric acid synthase [Cohnella thermotolerans]|uniref:cobyric acid synthase n=1 Tax=Cohnella thermotolerans TaxID=329858 RepID=UPI0003FDAD62|nr:cobyric acid synthase [Cohnella thermotolerans]
MREARTIMLQGTASDVGKSVLTAALCRIFKQDGYRVAPFKSQNMSNNSYVTPDGKEIGRAQGMQADACGIEATTDMNPILLKPTKDMVSQVVVHGKPYRDLDARTYRERYLPQAEAIVKEALGRLRQRFDIVVIEGAGSPAEINLKERDIVNMRLAEWADAPVLLVADIDRGGVFASIVGTLELLEPHERERVRGVVINKFRGDVSLLQPGIDWLERRLGKPVLGVVPYLPQLGLEDEDSASLDGKGGKGLTAVAPAGSRPIDIAVLRYPRISNFTDVDALASEPDVRLRYVTDPREWGEPDAVVLPGSKNTAEDLLFLRETGLEAKLLAYAERGGRIAGLCGGYQMMGLRLLDPDGVESGRSVTEALGLLPQETTFAKEKRTVRVAGSIAAGEEGTVGLPVEGYEIHMGVTVNVGSVRPLVRLRTADDPEDERPDGAVSEDGRKFGTYVHGLFDNDAFRRSWLNAIRRDKGLGPASPETAYRDGRERSFDRLAAHVRRHLDVARIYRMLEGE